MFGHRHGFQGDHPFMQMAGRFGGGRGFGPFGGRGGMRGGPGGLGDMLRAGRMLGDGDWKLITLMLLSQTPRHGYDIIKALEDSSSGFYVPSPGVVYPTLTYLEEAGYATSAPEGAKKVYSITEAGEAHLDENQELVGRVMEHLERFGRKMAKAREWFGADDERDEKRGQGRRGRNPQLRTLRHRLKAALVDIMEGPAGKQDEAVTILENAAAALEELAKR
jgi:DNA-binding PadR family transcriptional regulator